MKAFRGITAQCLIEHGIQDCNHEKNDAWLKLDQKKYVLMERYNHKN